MVKHAYRADAQAKDDADELGSALACGVDGAPVNQSLTERRSNMSAVIPFILERTAASTRATARFAQEQVELIKQQNALLEEILKVVMEQARKPVG